MLKEGMIPWPIPNIYMKPQPSGYQTALMKQMFTMTLQQLGSTGFCELNPPPSPALPPSALLSRPSPPPSTQKIPQPRAQNLWGGGRGRELGRLEVRSSHIFTG